MDNHKTLIIIFVVSVFVFSGLLLLFNQDKQDETPIELKKEDIVYDGCPVEFDLYKTDQFSICYPYKMEKVKNGSVSSDSAQLVVFSSEEEQLSFGLSEEYLLPVHLCNFEETVSIASTSALRTSMKKESVAGCSSVSRYVTKTDYLDSQFIIDFKRNEDYFENNERISVIEKSLLFKIIE